MAALNDMIKPTIVRLTHKDGSFAAEYDYNRGILRFVQRRGTVDYDLVAIAEEMRKQELQVEVGS